MSEVRIFLTNGTLDRFASNAVTEFVANQPHVLKITTEDGFRTLYPWANVLKIELDNPDE